MKLERDPRFLVLRGQMMYMTVWDSILFLCTPVYAYVCVIAAARALARAAGRIVDAQ